MTLLPTTSASCRSAALGNFLHFLNPRHMLIHSFLHVEDRVTGVSPDKKAYAVCAMPNPYARINGRRLSRRPFRERWITLCEAVRGGQQWEWSLSAMGILCSEGGMAFAGSRASDERGRGTCSKHDRVRRISPLSRDNPPRPSNGVGSCCAIRLRSPRL